MSFGKKGVSGGAPLGKKAATAAPAPPPTSRSSAESPQPATDDEAWLPPGMVMAEEPAVPFMTFGLLAMLTVVFVLEHHWGIGQPSWAPSLATLVALGGLGWPLVVENGEWWRLVSTAFLHGSFSHLLFNGLALFFVGRLLEGLIGPVWLLALYFIGALGGSLMSLAINPPNIVSIGASGAIMGLLAASLICSFRLPSHTVRSRIQRRLLMVMVPAMLPLAAGAHGQQTDFAAHCGGAMIGVLAGLLILKTWPEDDLQPAFGPAAAVVAGVGALCSVVALAAVLGTYPDHETMALMPNDLVHKPNTLSREQAVDLVHRFPHDPRARLYYADILLAADDQAGAEEQLRQALAEKTILATNFRPDLERRIRVVLAVTLARRDAAEAKAVAQPVCTGPASAERTMVAGARLCD